MSLVSVIIPTYNRAGFIGKAIESVERQGYENYEVVIIDDRSTDETESVVRDRAHSNARIKYLKNEYSKGVSGARNCGIDKASGEFIAFLDSDDEWYDDHLRSALGFFAEHPELDLFFANRLNFEIGSEEVRLDFFKYIDIVHILGAELCRDDFYIVRTRTIIPLLKANIFPIQSVVIRKESLGELRFDETMSVSEDRDFSLRFCLTKPRIIGLRLTASVKGTLHSSSLSSPSNENSILFHLAQIRTLTKARQEFDLKPQEKDSVNREIARRQLWICYQYRILRKFRSAAKYAFKALPRAPFPALAQLARIPVNALRIIKAK